MDVALKALQALHAGETMMDNAPITVTELPDDFNPAAPQPAPEQVAAAAPAVQMPLPDPFRAKPKLKIVEKPVEKPAPTWELRPIPPDKIDEWWPLVEEGIKEVLHKAKGFYKFTPKEIWVFLHRGAQTKTQLWIALIDGEYAGFGITRDMQDDWSMEPYLLSWIGVSLSPVAKQCYFRDLEPIAKAKGIYELRHYSTREGWLRKPPSEGWDALEFCQVKYLSKEPK